MFYKKLIAMKTNIIFVIYTAVIFYNIVISFIWYPFYI